MTLLITLQFQKLQKKSNLAVKALQKFFFAYLLMAINLQNLKAQTSTAIQLGPGAEGQLLPTYLYQNLAGNYDLYVGSDVLGAWVARGINPISITDIAQYHYQYLSNHRVFRFENKFYHPSSYKSDYLFVGNRSGIDRINLNDYNHPIKSIVTAIDLSKSWVSDIYIRHDKQIYFVTGNTRVTVVK